MTARQHKPTRMLLTLPPALTHFIDEDVSHLHESGVMRSGRQDVIRTILEKHYLRQEQERGKDVLITGIRHNSR